MKVKLAVGVFLLCGVAGALAWSRRGSSSPEGGDVDGFTALDVERILQHSPIGDPPADPTNAVADLPAAAEFGQAIFFDKRFSGTGKTACSTCHDPAKGFGDGKPMTEAFPIDRNIPTLWNIGYGRWFFWDGRSDSLWSQALKPLENPKEQGSTRLQVAHLLHSDARLRSSYERVFGTIADVGDWNRFPAKGGPVIEGPDGPLNRAWASMTAEDRGVIDRIFSNAGKAIEAYERRLVSRRSKFDEYVEGLRTRDESKLRSLSPAAKLGLRIFVGKGNCRLCHSGPAFTDGEFHNLGIPPSRGGPTASRFAAIPEVRNDPFNGKGIYSDDREVGAKKLDYLVDLPDTWGQVKTPGLRNVAKTGPYMHQGQFRTLEEVVQFYSMLRGVLQAGHHERTILLPLFLERQEVAALVEFLGSLTDESVDPRLLRPPEQKKTAINHGGD